MRGLSLSLVDGPAEAQPVIIFDHTRVSSLPHFSQEDRDTLAAMLGCRVDQLMEAGNAPALFAQLQELSLGLTLSSVYEPYEIDPAGAPA
jgi:hypothetical protein